MPVRGTDPDLPSAGFTLIELMISLALFALISLAGIRLVESIAGIQDRTSGRAERLGELQRALFLMTADFEQMTAGPEREGDRLTLTRVGSTGSTAVMYSLQGGALHRSVNGNDHVIVTGVRGLAWRFFKNGAWVDRPATTDDLTRPRAVEIVLDIPPGQGGRSGRVRRVIELTAEP